MGIYLSGVIVVLVYYIITYIIRIIKLPSRITEFDNYAQIGKRYSVIQGRYYFIPSKENRHDAEKNNADRLICRYQDKNKRRKNDLYTLCVQFILSPLLSRISVLIILYGFFNIKSKKNKLPKEVKEKLKDYEYKLKFTKLSKRQTRIIDYNLDKIKGVETWDNFPGDRGRFTLERDRNCISYSGWREEYKIKGTDIQIRVIDERGKNKNDEYVYFIENGVITDEKPEEKFWTKEDRKEAIKRKPSICMRESAYILYYNEKLSDDEYKDYLRERIDNLDSCWDELKKFFKKHSINFVKEYEGEKYYLDSYEWYQTDKTSGKEAEKNRDKFYKEMEKITKKYGFEDYQIKNIIKIGELEGEDNTERTLCYEKTWDAFIPEILPFYKGLIQDI